MRIKNFDHIDISTENSFHDFFNAMYVPLLSFAIGYIGNKEDAEDLIQEVFVKVWENKERYKSIIELKPYLFKSVRNKCINHIRDKTKHNIEIDRVDQSGMAEKSILHSIIKEEVYQQLCSSIEALPKQCKKIYIMSLQGMKASDIAEELEISIETVKAQKKRGKKFIKRSFETGNYLLTVIILGNLP